MRSGKPGGEVSIKSDFLCGTLGWVVVVAWLDWDGWIFGAVVGVG